MITQHWCAFVPSQALLPPIPLSPLGIRCDTVMMHSPLLCVAWEQHACVVPASPPERTVHCTSESCSTTGGAMIHALPLPWLSVRGCG